VLLSDGDHGYEHFILDYGIEDSKIANAELPLGEGVRFQSLSMIGNRPRLVSELSFDLINYDPLIALAEPLQILVRRFREANRVRHSGPFHGAAAVSRINLVIPRSVSE
jgi:hypothetical protein